MIHKELSPKIILKIFHQPIVCTFLLSDTVNHQHIDKTLSLAETDKKVCFSCQINLQGGPALQPRDDVMLHLSVRPQENVIVRNHMKDQVFGAEERHGGNPIQAHQSFEIAITAEHSQYRISVNGNHFCTFTHRLPLHLVKFVSISGTCTISHIISDQSGGSTVYPPVHVHPMPPSYPIHHHPPAPPPMPPMAPPPYPGL